MDTTFILQCSGFLTFNEFKLPGINKVNMKYICLSCSILSTPIRSKVADYLGYIG